MPAGGHQVRFQPIDVSDESQVAELIDVAETNFGGLDIVFNNAGVGGAIGSLLELGVEHWDRIDHPSRALRQARGDRWSGGVSLERRRWFRHRTPDGSRRRPVSHDRLARRSRSHRQTCRGGRHRRDCGAACTRDRRRGRSNAAPPGLAPRRTPNTQQRSARSSEAILLHCRTSVTGSTTFGNRPESNCIEPAPPSTRRPKPAPARKSSEVLTTPSW